MTSSFSQRFGRSSSRPDCYGDPEIYNVADSECRNCSSRPSCKYVVDRKLGGNTSSRDLQTRNRSTTSTRVSRKSTNVNVMDYDEDDTFLNTLTHNAMLNAVQGMADTFSDAIGSIPRKKYPNPYARIKKRRRSEEDYDD